MPGEAAAPSKDDEVAALKSRIAQLERELQQHATRPPPSASASEHDGTTTPLSSSSSSLVSKSGYLFKWQDRSIGWGGTKWGLRFVSLSGGRLSYYRSHTDQMARYVLPLRRCAVRDDGCKLNRKHKSSGSSSNSSGDAPDLNEVGAYYHVFSIYQRPERQGDGKGVPASPCADDDDDSRIVPLLRFSTPSLAEKNQWIDLISEACAYADSEDFLVAAKDQGTGAGAGASSTPTRDVPVARPGTLPPLIFGAPAYRPRRTPSGTKLSPMGAKKKSYTKIASAADSARSNRRNVAAYPPSKPMHRAAEPSFLSDEAPSQNFRGLLNLALIVLVVSNFRLILDTVQKHGFVLANIRSINLEEWRHAPLTVSPFLSGAALLILSTFLGYVIEVLLGRKYVKEWIGIGLHLVNANIVAFLVPALIVWNFIDSPAVGAFLLVHATITWMKLISYAHANSDYRASPESHTATLALLKDLDAGSADIAYPMNVTLGNIFYFWLAPTLTYQIVFPRSPQIRLTKIAGILFRLVVAIAFLLFLVAQVISPNLDNLLKELETSGDAVFSWHIFGDYLLKLSIANTYVWLLMFYIYFHLYLNLFAEILRFGDRVFYRDWWNASNVSSYWRLWNMPVHFWLVRHVYFPCYRLGMSKTAATFVVFLVSAILHEVLVSVPFHIVRHWSFLGMLGQVPLVAITKYFDRLKPGSSIGNIIFWTVFCVVGQPMAVLMYTIDYWKASRAEVCDA